MRISFTVEGFIEADTTEEAETLLEGALKTVKAEELDTTVEEEMIEEDEEEDDEE